MPELCQQLAQLSQKVGPAIKVILTIRLIFR
jgi:hypothetical protein